MVSLAKAARGLAGENQARWPKFVILIGDAFQVGPVDISSLEGFNKFGKSMQTSVLALFDFDDPAKKNERIEASILSTMVLTLNYRNPPSIFRWTQDLYTANLGQEIVSMVGVTQRPYFRPVVDLCTRGAFMHGILKNKAVEKDQLI